MRPHALYRFRMAGLLISVAVTIGLAACDEALDILGVGFSPDSCAEFRFWRDDTLLVKNLLIGVERGQVEDGLTVNCRVQIWDFEEGDSWMLYAISGPCQQFDAEVHQGNQYFEVTHGDVIGIYFAEGEWKLHEVTDDVDVIIDGGTFEFEFHDANTCD